jgi:hypothetical protein
MSGESDSEDGCGELLFNNDQHAHHTLYLSFPPSPDKDHPVTWRFGPSYGSDMIIVAARGINLV